VATAGPDSHVWTISYSIFLGTPLGCEQSDIDFCVVDGGRDNRAHLEPTITKLIAHFLCCRKMQTLAALLR
jgi:hypothetical protein